MTHTWKIYNLERTITDGVVNKVTYACETSNDQFSNRAIDSINITGSTSDEGFILYENLVEGDILAWVTSSIDTSIFETQNSSSIATMVSASAARTKAEGLPWE